MEARITRATCIYEPFICDTGRTKRVQVCEVKLKSIDAVWCALLAHAPLHGLCDGHRGHWLLVVGSTRPKDPAMTSAP